MDSDALYREVTEKHGAALGRLVAAYEPDPTRRRELLREIHASVWKSLALFDQRISLRTWVFRVAHNVGILHLAQQRGARLDKRPPLDRQIVSLHRDGLDALAISEITGVSPSKVALALHRLKVSIQGPVEPQPDLPTAFTVAELRERGVDAVAGETNRFLEKLLAEQRSDQLFRLGASVFLIPLLFLIRPAAEHSGWALATIFTLIGGVTFVVSRQLLALGATTRALTEMRAPDVSPPPRPLPLVLALSVMAVGTGISFAALIKFDRLGERQASERRREQAVDSVTRCLDPRTDDPACVSVLGGRRPKLEAPITQVTPAPDCRERQRALASTSDLGSLELTLLEAMSLGEACPEQLLLPSAVLKNNVLADVTEAARRECFGSDPEKALERCGVYARFACQGTSNAWRDSNEAFLTFLSLRERKEPGAAAWQCVDSPVVGLLRAFSVATTEEISLDSFEAKDGATRLSGFARRRAGVAEFTRRLNDIVRTPSGLGRVVETDRDGQARVELLASPDAFELAAAEVRPLFARVDVDSVRPSQRAGPNEGARFEFELTLRIDRSALPIGKEWTAPYVPDVMVQHFAERLRAGPENAEAWLSLGYARKAQNKPRDAVEAFKRYLELQPDTSNRKELEAQIYFLGGQ